MKRNLTLSFCLVFLQACLYSALYSAELANDGATGWKIVLPDEPTSVERTAARELAEHLKLVTGADLQTVSEKDVPTGGKSLMFVGHRAKAPKKDCKFDEILIKMDGGNDPGRPARLMGRLRLAGQEVAQEHDSERHRFRLPRRLVRQ